MTTRISVIAFTPLFCLPIGISIGFLIHSNQSYRFQSLDSPVGSERGFGKLTGFFKDESNWQGGVSKTDGRNMPEWFAFYNRNGKREGPVIHYWPAGNISTVTHFRDGKMHGQYMEFSRVGTLVTVGYYDNGELVVDSEFRNLNPTEAVNDFFANIGNANLQLEEKFRGAFLRGLHGDSILKKSK